MEYTKLAWDFTMRQYDPMLSLILLTSCEFRNTVTCLLGLKLAWYNGESCLLEVYDEISSIFALVCPFSTGERLFSSTSFLMEVPLETAFCTTRVLEGS